MMHTEQKAAAEEVHEVVVVRFRILERIRKWGSVQLSSERCY